MPIPGPYIVLRRPVALLEDSRCLLHGQIPKYALMPDGAFCATTVFYKLLNESPI
jgi:hypothetical protein